MTNPKPSDFGTDLSTRTDISLRGGQVGDNWPPENKHEPRQVGLADPNPDGGRARRSDPVVEKHADPCMARTSFPAAVSAYLHAMRPYLSEGTLIRKARNLRVVHEDLKAIESERSGKSVRVKAPAALAERDVEALLLRWRSRPNRHGGALDSSTQAKYLMDLDGFLAWCGNPVIELMRKKRHVRFPRPLAKPIRVLDGDELERIRIAAEAIEGWPGCVARFLISFLPASGLRRKEFRLAQLRDLDLGRGRILVAHPKGENVYSAPDYAPVLMTVRLVLEDYLAEREAYLAGETSEWLVPYRRVSGKVGPWSDAMIGWLKGELAQRSGVAFSLKTFRATFGQRSIDGGARIEAVSRAMRHASTRTTEAYYARIRADDAFHEIEKAFTRPRVRTEPSL